MPNVPTWDEIEASAEYGSLSLPQKAALLDRWSEDVRKAAKGMAGYRPDDEEGLNNFVNFKKQVYQNTALTEGVAGTVQQTGQAFDLAMKGWEPGIEFAPEMTQVPRAPTQLPPELGPRRETETLSSLIGHTFTPFTQIDPESVQALVDVIGGPAREMNKRVKPPLTAEQEAERRGMYEAAAKNLSTLNSVGGWGSLIGLPLAPGAAQGLAGAYFGWQGIKGMAEARQQYKEAERTGNEELKGEAKINALFSTATAAGGGLGLAYGIGKLPMSVEAARVPLSRRLTERGPIDVEAEAVPPRLPGGPLRALPERIPITPPYPLWSPRALPPVPTEPLNLTALEQGLRQAPPAEGGIPPIPLRDIPAAAPPTLIPPGMIPIEQPVPPPIASPWRGIPGRLEATRLREAEGIPLPPIQFQPPPEPPSAPPAVPVPVTPKPTLSPSTIPSKPLELMTPVEAISLPETEPMAVMQKQLDAARDAIVRGDPVSASLARSYDILHEIIKAKARYSYNPETDMFVPSKDRFTVNPKAWTLIAKLDTLDLRQRKEGESQQMGDERAKLTKALTQMMGFVPNKKAGNLEPWLFTTTPPVPTSGAAPVEKGPANAIPESRPQPVSQPIGAEVQRETGANVLRDERVQETAPPEAQVPATPVQNEVALEKPIKAKGKPHPKPLDLKPKTAAEARVRRVLEQGEEAPAEPPATKEPWQPEWVKKPLEQITAKEYYARDLLNNQRTGPRGEVLFDISGWTVQAKEQAGSIRDAFIYTPEKTTQTIAEFPKGTHPYIAALELAEAIKEGDGPGESWLPIEHKNIIQQALDSAKPVPPEVLADYPDLKPPAPVPKPSVLSPGTKTAHKGYLITRTLTGDSFIVSKDNTRIATLNSETEARKAIDELVAPPAPEPKAEAGKQPSFIPTAARFAQFYVDAGVQGAVALKNGRALMDAIEQRKWTDLLRPDNKISRNIWKTWTGKSLPSGISAAKKAFQDFVDNYTPQKPGLTAAKESAIIESEIGAQQGGGIKPKVNPQAGEAGFIDLQGVIDLGKQIYRKGMEYAQWAGEMVKRFGERVSQYLKDAWTKVTETSLGSVAEKVVKQFTPNYTKGDLIPLRMEDTEVPHLAPYAERKQIVTRPVGAGNVPGFAQLNLGAAGDPRFHGGDPVEAAIITHANANEVGKGLALLNGAESQWADDAFGLTEKGGGIATKVKVKEGQSQYIEDIIRDWLKNPNSYDLDPSQRAAIRYWTSIRDQGIQLLKDRGIELKPELMRLIFETEDSPYFPRQAVGKKNVPKQPQKGGGNVGVGGKPSWTKERLYETEVEGARTTIYEPLFSRRLATWVKSIYKLIADYDFLNDPALQGRSVKERTEAIAETAFPELRAIKTAIENSNNPAQAKAMYNRYRDVYEDLRADFPDQFKEMRGKAEHPLFQKEGKVYHPAFGDRIFPIETANRLNKLLTESTHGWVRWLHEASKTGNTFQLQADNSTPFIQGLPLLFWSAFNRKGVFGPAWIAGWKAFANPQYLRKFMLDDKLASGARELSQLGVPLGRLEDYMATSEWVAKIPAIGPLFKRFGAMAGAFLDLAKIMTWNALKEAAPKTEWPALAERIQQLLGSTRMESIGIHPGQALGERMLWRAAAYYRSAPNLVAGLFERGASGKLSRQAIGSFIAGIALTTFAGWILSGLSWEQMKEKIKRMDWTVPIDFLGKKFNVGFNHVLLSLSKLGMQTAGWVKDEETIDQGGVAKNPILRWLWSHSGPIPAAETEIALSHDFLGNPSNWRRVAAKYFTPIAVQQGQQIQKNEGIQGVVGNALPSIGGLNVYSEMYQQTYWRLANEFARKYYGKDYAQLRTSLQADVTARMLRSKELPKKPEATPLQIQRAEELAAKTRKRLREGLSQENQTLLDKYAAHVTGYEPQISFGSGKGRVQVKLTARQIADLEPLIIAEYNRALRGHLATLANAEDKQETVNKILQEAKQKAITLYRQTH